jgi:alpha-tubulin suppressor-like RCC1 family protein
MLALVLACSRTQLGDGGLAAGTSVTGVEEIAAGGFHSCARWSDGTVRCWGEDEFGQLGDNGSPARCAVDVGTDAGHAGDAPLKPCGRTPQLVVDLPAATAIAAGEAHSCAVLADGGVACWGANEAGQLGDGTTTDRHTPVAVVDLKHVVEVAAGGHHTCARMNDGSVACWGSNYFGQLGDTSLGSSSRPVRVAAVADATRLALGRFHSCAVRASGDVVCWGEEQSYWTGRPHDVVDVSAAVGRTCALGRGGEVWCTFLGCMAPPGATRIAISDSGGCVLTAASAVYCNGVVFGDHNDHGCTCYCRESGPMQGLDTDVTAIAIGFEHLCALMRDSTVRCVGDDTFGQLGDGKSGPMSMTPSQVVW